MSPQRPTAAAVLLALIVAVGCQKPFEADEQHFAEQVHPLDTVTSPLLLILVQGNNQTGVIHGVLADSLVVRAMTQSGHPVPGILVRWLSTNDGASLTPPNLTDDNGYARAGWILGNRSGAQLAWAIATGLSNATYFSATATDSVGR